MKLDELIEERRGDILRIAEKHGAKNVRVFGSLARGEATEDSDIDLLVDVGDNPSQFFPGGLLAELQELLGRRVDIVTEDGLHWHIKDKVMSEAVPL